MGIALCLLTGFLAAIAYLALRGLAFTDNPEQIHVVWLFSMVLG